MDIQKFKARLEEIRQQLSDGTLDEIPQDARPKMPDFDYDQDSYIVVSYSRKDFVEVYLFLAYLYQEGCRFWYDNGMQGQDKWLTEFRDKYENPNCLGTITFYSDNYISNSTKEELSILYGEDGYEKRNVMISLVALRNMDPDKVLKNAILEDRISIENAAAIKPVLTDLIAEEKEKTIHRYAAEADILPLIKKLEQVFSIQGDSPEQMPTDSQKNFMMLDGVLYKYTGKAKEVVLPPTIKRIGEGAFSRCETLERIVLPEGLVGIGSAAFDYCSQLKEIDFPDSLMYIGNWAFHECTSLSSITIPNGVEEINDYCFAGCTNLTEVFLPVELTEICEGAFEGCVKLEYIILPYGVDTIGDNAFAHCSALENMRLPDSLTTIGQEAFARCDALWSMGIPGNVKSIGYGAFLNCPLLGTVFFQGTIQQWERIQKGNNLGLKEVICLISE